MSTRFFGQYLLSRGLLTADQLLSGVEYQNREHPRLGELAVARGAVSEDDARRIHALQASEDLFFGEAATKLGFMTPAEVTELLGAQQDRHVHLGQALVELGHLNEGVMRKALAAFEQAEADRPPPPTLPPEWPGSALATPLFDLLPRVLMRAWGFAAKPDTPIQRDDHAVLSDLNVRIAVHADVAAALMLGIPYAAAHQATVGDDELVRPSEDAVHATVLQLAEMLCHQLTSLLAERGQRMTRESATLCASRLPLPDGTRAVVMPFHTHVGTALAGVVA